MSLKVFTSLSAAVFCICWVTACGGSSPRPNGSAQAASIINGNSEGTAYTQLADASGARCKPSAQVHGHSTYSCTWTLDGSIESGTWVLLAGALFRVSRGGSGGAPPQDAQAATALVNRSLSASGRASGRDECFALRPTYETLNGQRLLLTGAHTFLCALLNSSGTPLESNGEPVVEKWQWTAQGYVDNDTLDVLSSDEQTVANDLASSESAGAAGTSSKSHTGGGTSTPSSSEATAILSAANWPNLPAAYGRTVVYVAPATGNPDYAIVSFWPTADAPSQYGQSFATLLRDTSGTWTKLPVAQPCEDPDEPLPVEVESALCKAALAANPDSTNATTTSAGSGDSASTGGSSDPYTNPDIRCGTVQEGSDRGDTLTVYTSAGISCGTAEGVFRAIADGDAANHETDASASSYFVVGVANGSQWVCPYASVGTQFCTQHGHYRIETVAPGSQP